MLAATGHCWRTGAEAHPARVQGVTRKDDTPSPPPPPHTWTSPHTTMPSWLIHHVCQPMSHMLTPNSLPRASSYPTQPTAPAARQATAFGAALDVLVDNTTRMWLWCGALPGGLGALPATLEATVFAFTHAVSPGRCCRAHASFAIHQAQASTQAHALPTPTRARPCNRAAPRRPQAAGARWKAQVFEAAPPWAAAVMANGFRSPAGAAAVAGLMGCPLWAWAGRCART